MRKGTRLRAIDLYSGVGGWSLGLRLAGIDVVASYEMSGAANETNFKNNRHQAQTVDIRGLALDELPRSIDVVVGSPPCTQFSFSNRGGNGDIADGLTDIVKFLTIVDHLKPSFWAMENVPRVAKIIEEELKPGGRLRRFRHLDLKFRVINMEKFGLPQRRTRCIAGNLPFDLLESYADHTNNLSLGDVIRALSAPRVRDPIYGFLLRKDHLRDHVMEAALNPEETRINRANKTAHPVYNAMPFPDSLARSVRTITATCTRVCRESVIIPDLIQKDCYRRLTLRERASLQGFPITFQFYGATYAKKLKMIGNAIPPAFSYYVAHAIKGSTPMQILPLDKLNLDFKLPAALPDETRPRRAGFRYPLDRTFRFAIPSARLKSGVRFELANEFEDDSTRWRVDFYFGSSKSIHSIELTKSLHQALTGKLPITVRRKVVPVLEKLAASLRAADVARMQTVWTHRGVGRTTPFMLLDLLDDYNRQLESAFSEHIATSEALVLWATDREFPSHVRRPAGLSKLQRYAPIVLAGLLMGSLANCHLVVPERVVERRRSYDAVLTSA